MGTRGRAGIRTFSPAELSPLSAWLRLADPGTTVESNAYSSVRDMYGGAPAAQTTSTKRPAAVLAANGRPVMSFDGGDNLVWPVGNTSNNTSPRAGVAMWTKLTSVAVLRLIHGTVSGAGGGSANRVQLYQNNADLVVEVYYAAGDNRRGTVPSCLTTAWQFITWEFDGDQPNDELKCVLSINGTPQTVTFTNAVGTPNAMPAVLVQPTGNAFLGDRLDVQFPYVGLMGGNVFYLGGTAETGALGGLLAPASRLKLMEFDRPT